MERSAGVYLLKDALLLHAIARMRRGIGMVSPPVWRLLPTAAAADAGASLLDALSAFQTVPDSDPAERKARSANFLKAARVRSWRALQHDSRSCWIVETDGVIAFTPLRNGGNKGATKGFQPFGAPCVSVEIARGAAAVGEALLLALNTSE
jgi:hypothetical protein